MQLQVSLVPFAKFRIYLHFKSLFAVLKTFFFLILKVTRCGNKGNKTFRLQIWDQFFRHCQLKNDNCVIIHLNADGKSDEIHCPQIKLCQMSPRLLQLFRRMLQNCFAVKLQECFVDWIFRIKVSLFLKILHNYVEFKMIVLLNTYLCFVRIKSP